MSEFKINNIIKNNLCTGCGTCAGICPNSSIEMIIEKKKGIYIPKINYDECNDCGLCVKSCPANTVYTCDHKIESSEKKQYNFLIGHFNGCYLAHSTDNEIRINSSSGGLITSLLIFALEQGFIEGALVTRMKKDNPLIPEPFIAKTKEEIIEASKSKYCPVPTNVAIKEILKQNAKIAVVGLPCHIKGFRKAETNNKQLKQRIAYYFGILCSHTDTFNGIHYVLDKLNIEEDNVRNISYRGGGWPGGISIKLKNGDEKKVPLATPLWINFHDSLFFSPSCCLFCSDVNAEFADLSFGDPWLPKIMVKEKEGKSIVISRSKSGQELLHSAYSSSRIEISILNPDDVIESQKKFIHFKKINLATRIRICQLTGNKIVCNNDSMKNSLLNILIALVYLINSNLLCNKTFMNIFRLIPTKIIFYYVLIYSTAYSLIIRRDFDNYVEK